MVVGYRRFEHSIVAVQSRHEQLVQGKIDKKKAGVGSVCSQAHVATARPHRAGVSWRPETGDVWTSERLDV